MTSLTTGKYYRMNEDEVPKCVAKSCCPLPLSCSCGRGMITFCLITGSWKNKPEMLKHCDLQDLTVLRAMVCSLEKRNNFCETCCKNSVHSKGRAKNCCWHQGSHPTGGQRFCLVFSFFYSSQNFLFTLQLL